MPANTFEMLDRMTSGYVAYSWLTSTGFLLPAVIPDSTVIEATPDDDPDALMRLLIPGTSFFHFHLNCTRTAHFPVRRESLLQSLRERDIATVNAAVTDISKRAVQATCLHAGLNQTAACRSGDSDEQLIVKTDLNFGGDSEWALDQTDRERLALGRASGVMWKPNDYRVMTRGAIPDHWWDDSTLVQERFVVNRDDRWYRAFLFFSRTVLVELVDRSQIKKVGHSFVSNIWKIDRRERVTLEGVAGGVAEAVGRFADAAQVQFGAIDVVVNDEEAPFIIDLNTTPAYTFPVPGLADYLRGALEN